jgi:hypothetical protein
LGHEGVDEPDGGSDELGSSPLSHSAIWRGVVKIYWTRTQELEGQSERVGGKRIHERWKDGFCMQKLDHNC